MRNLCKVGNREATRSSLRFRSSLVAGLSLECREAKIETREFWGLLHAEAMKTGRVFYFLNSAIHCTCGEDEGIK